MDRINEDREMSRKKHEEAESIERRWCENLYGANGITTEVFWRRKNIQQNT